MTRALVSVVVPVYNVAPYLDDCLNSLRSQTYANLDIIIVDDCSSDESIALVGRHLESDARIRLLRHQSNLGLSAARNTGLDAASGEYIVFVDADDIPSPYLVEHSLAVTREYGLDVFVFDFCRFDSCDIPIAFKCHLHSSYQCVVGIGRAYFELPYYAWTKFIRTDFLRNIGLRFPVGYCYEDHPFHWALGLSNAKIGRSSCILYHYRQREGSITTDNGIKILDIIDMSRLIIKLFHASSNDLVVYNVMISRLASVFMFVCLNVSDNLIPLVLKRASNLIRDDVLPFQIGASVSLRNRLFFNLLSGPHFFTLAALRSIRWLRRSLDQTDLGDIVRWIYRKK